MGTTCGPLNKSKTLIFETDNNKDNNNINANNQNRINDLKMIWIDPKINNKENTFYANELEKILPLTLCKSINESLNEIKKRKFERLIIMLSQKMFNDFIILFEQEKTKICCSLNIIVFTHEEKKKI